MIEEALRRFEENDDRRGMGTGNGSRAQKMGEPTIKNR